MQRIVMVLKLEWVPKLRLVSDRSHDTQKGHGEQIHH